MKKKKIKKEEEERCLSGHPMAQKKIKNDGLPPPWPMDPHKQTLKKKNCGFWPLGVAEPPPWATWRWFGHPQLPKGQNQSFFFSFFFVIGGGSATPDRPMSHPSSFFFSILLLLIFYTVPCVSLSS
jgi:hypothetical protein